MSGHEIPMSMGALFAGFLLGMAAYRKLQRLAQPRRHSGPCAVCRATSEYLVECERCRKWVAMCHYWGVLMPADPDPAKISPRRSRQLCTACVSSSEESAFRG